MLSVNRQNSIRRSRFLLRDRWKAILLFCIALSSGQQSAFAQPVNESESNRRSFVGQTSDRETAPPEYENPSEEQQPQEGLALPADPANTSLPWFLQLAIENHPALEVASADVVAAKQEALQASLLPNPKLGIFADEVGNEDSAGLIGIFLQRRIIRGGKLELARRVKCRESDVLTQTQLQQLQRIETDVQTEFYRLLVAQRRMELTAQLQQLQADALGTAQTLFESSETPKTDLLQEQVQSGRVDLQHQQAEIAATAAWRRLATAVSFPGSASSIG